MLPTSTLTHISVPEFGLRGIRKGAAHCFARPSAFMKSTCA